MKKFYYLLASIAIVLVTIIACEEASIEMDESQAIQDEVLLARPAGKVTICHYDDGIVDDGPDHEPQWVTINISMNALEAHRKHGDKYDWDGDGYYPENECDIMGEMNAYDCDDDNIAINPGVDADGDGINYCDDCDDDKLPYSPEGEYTIYKNNGAWYHFNLDLYDSNTDTYSGIGEGRNNSNVMYSDLQVTAVVITAPDMSLTIEVWVNGEPGVGKELSGTVSECNGITAITTADYSLNKFDGVTYLPIP